MERNREFGLFPGRRTNPGWWQFPAGRWFPARFARFRDRLAVEAQLAAESALAPHEVIVEALVSSGARALPPIATTPTMTTGHPRELVWQPEPPPSPRVLHVFVAAGVGRDYQRRARVAAERMFRPLGAVAREG